MKTSGDMASKLNLPKFLTPINNAPPRASIFHFDKTANQSDSEDDSNHISEVDVTDFIEGDVQDETFTDIQKHLETKAVSSGAEAMVNEAAEQGKGFWQKLPELPEDYVRNFMYHRGMMKALEAFQDEWYEFKLMGKLRPEDTVDVPTVYKQNEKMSEMLNTMREQVNRHQHTVSEVKRNFEQLTRERDYHRMHHKRLQHEKDKLIEEVKKLKKDLEAFEPMLKQSRAKVEAVIKEKTLLTLDRDRLNAQIKDLQSQIQVLKEVRAEKRAASSQSRRTTSAQTHLKENAASKTDPITTSQPIAKRPHPFPEKERPNPYLLEESEKKEPIVNEMDSNMSLTSDMQRLDARASSLIRHIKQSTTFQAHSGHITCVASHPKENMMATTSNDKTWKLWKNSEVVLVGEGHQNAVTGCDFHPHESLLATCSSDNTVKLWNTTSGSVVKTLKEHIQPVLSARYHDLGNILLTTSIDHTVKLWDVERGKVRQNIRHHSDAVKCGVWKPYSNMFFTCGADKKVTVWDARSNVSLHSFTHQSSVNHVAVAKQGHVFAACNSTGQVMIYDLRKMNVLQEITIQTHKLSTKSHLNKVPLNTVEFHRNSELIAVGGLDGFLRLVHWTECTQPMVVPWFPGEFTGYDPNTMNYLVPSTGISIGAIDFNPHLNRFVSAGSDGYLRIY